MPSSKVYQVDLRYTSVKAVEKKLRKIFPGSRVSDFKVKMINDIISYTTPRILTSDEEESLKKDGN